MATKSKGTGAIAILKEDHKKVRALLEKLEKTTERAGETREDLLERIGQELSVHTTIEEEIFYPAYKEAVSKRDDEKIYYEAVEEHHLVDGVLAEMKSGNAETQEFSAKAKLLKDLVEHHASEEESRMFPRAERAMNQWQLEELGKQISARKRELQSSGEGILPAAGKLLAVVTGRTSLRRATTQASAAARGAAAGKRSTATKTRSRAKSSPRSKGKTSARSRGKSTKGARRK